MPVFEIRCEWCKRFDLPPHVGGPTYCPDCGHRLGMPPSCCDCVLCSRKHAAFGRLDHGPADDRPPGEGL